MTDILTHALGALAGALSVWLAMRRKVHAYRDEADFLRGELTLHIQAIRDLRAKQPARDAKGHFVSKRKDAA